LGVDAANVISGGFGSKKHVPWEVRSLIGGLAFADETADCLMRANDKHVLNKKTGQTVLADAESSQANSVKMAMCPMKYAGAAMDFLSGINNVAGIQNTRLPQDFKMVFGGQKPYGSQYGAPAYGGQTHYQTPPYQRLNAFNQQQKQQQHYQHPFTYTR